MPEIDEQFDMTPYERACCDCLGTMCPTFLHDPEYAPLVRCFVHDYLKTHEWVAPDVAEMMRAYDTYKIPSPNEREAKQAEALQRRRKVVDDLIARTGYVPDAEELAKERERCRRVQEFYKQ